MGRWRNKTAGSVKWDIHGGLDRQGNLRVSSGMIRADRYRGAVEECRDARGRMFNVRLTPDDHGDIESDRRTINTGRLLANKGLANGRVAWVTTMSDGSVTINVEAQGRRRGR